VLVGGSVGGGASDADMNSSRRLDDYLTGASTMTKRTNRSVWGLAGVLGIAVVLLGWASVPYVGQRLPITRPYVWVRVSRAVVSVDGMPTRSPVYRSCDGHLLLWDLGYVFFPEDGDVVPVPEGSFLDDMPETNHILATCNFALVTDDHYCPGVLCDGGVENRYSHAIVRRGYIEFPDGGQLARVRVNL
jgi:hypothetical protein